MKKKINIIDVTLRDGEQTPGISFSGDEKLNIARLLLEEVKVDFIEVASAGISEGELESVKKITSWAANNSYLEKIEVLGFVNKNSIDWIEQTGGKVVNLLCKGSLKHVKSQLKKTPKNHVKDIIEVIDYANSKGIKVNIYLEDWSSGMKDSPYYVDFLLDNLENKKIRRIMLADTLGALNPDLTFEYCKKLIDKYPKLEFDFHGHNDYDLAVANSLAAVRAGVSGIHTSINGLGERTGNACLSSVAVGLKDHFKKDLNITENKLGKISRLLEVYTHIEIPSNKPVIGESVFTQCCGVHADGDKKGNLYCNKLDPKRFSRERQYALGKMSGRASILKNIEKLKIDLDDETLKKVVKKVVELGDKKESVTTDDLPFIISDIQKTQKINALKLLDFKINHQLKDKPEAEVFLEINGQKYRAKSRGDGQYDAFMKATGKILKDKKIIIPKLIDYKVRIPSGGSTEALVETTIKWKKGAKEFITKGLDTDQVTSSIKATVKMLNLYI